MDITSHALLRFIERVHQVDLVELKLLYILEKRVTSLRSLYTRKQETDFIRWIDAKIDLSVFRRDLLKKLKALPEVDFSNKEWTHRVAEGKYVYVMRDSTLITIIDQELPYEP